ncbi:FAD-dependent monooxygenase [Streptomyces sviceus]|uniref:FAD-dependent monooxygenase n=1 Tax=Streptomyces sviceus TaxID=285530 RepID=UPI00332EC5A7
MSRSPRCCPGSAGSTRRGSRPCTGPAGSCRPGTRPRVRAGRRPGPNVDAANLGRKLAAVVHGWVGEDILDTFTTERRPVAARLLQNTWAQIALMRRDPQTRALWEMFSDLMDLDDAHRYVADMLAGMDVRYALATTTGSSTSGART